MDAEQAAHIKQMEKMDKKIELKQLLKEMLSEGEIEIRVQEVFIPNRLDHTQCYKVEVAIDGRVYYEKIDGWNHDCLQEQSQRFRRF